MANEINGVERRRGKGPSVAAGTAILALAGVVFGRAAEVALWLILILSAGFFLTYHFELKRAQDRRTGNG